MFLCFGHNEKFRWRAVFLRFISYSLSALFSALALHYPSADDDTLPISRPFHSLFRGADQESLGHPPEEFNNHVDLSGDEAPSDPIEWSPCSDEALQKGVEQWHRITREHHEDRQIQWKQE
jgi:hypothetical protein